MHTEVKGTKSIGIKVTNGENRTEEPVVIGIVSYEGYCVCGYKDTIAKRPKGPGCEGHQGRRRTHVTDRGHIGHTETEGTTFWLQSKFILIP